MKSVIRVRKGSPFPLGAAAMADGVNFALFSRHAAAVSLVIYDDRQSRVPLRVIALDPSRHRERFIWHVFVEGLEPGVWFAWRVDGKSDRGTGDAFDARRDLLDPFARRVSTALWLRDPDSPGNSGIRGQVTAQEHYDWEGDEPVLRPLEDEVIYELHVGGYTRHASSGVAAPGTFAGLQEKIPRLKDLGVTAVELLPVMAFDSLDVPPGALDLGLENYWGYSTYGWYALHPAYSSAADERTEFRDLIKAMHRAGIAVVLDVVFNHTAEGGPESPPISLRGIDNRTYYHLDPDNPQSYRDYTGCGNSVNCNHPIVAALITDCLEYWVTEFHVDGFRLDLASVLARDESGEPDPHARVLWQIEQSPVLRDRILIAEPWDAVGLHQVGSFPGFAWSEWNDRYRDIVRAFLRGEGGVIGELATRISGNSDLYAYAGKRPRNSINFVTCHDGFTLADLVAFNEKHNEANGEANLDGHDHNVSWNSGIEGPTEDADVRRLRLRRARNFIAVLLLSQGVPMLNAGDERLRSQRGNNNAYCQNNEISWIDWSDTPEAADMTRFVRAMIALRRRHPGLRRHDFISGDHEQTAILRWFGRTLDAPDWHDPHARVLCFRLEGLTAHEPALTVLMNMDKHAYELPLPEGRWKRLVDTALPAPLDIVAPKDAKAVSGGHYRVDSFTVVILERA